MGHLSIHCNGCGSDWVVHHRDDWKDWKARTCPVCGKSINQGTWERSVLRGFGEMEEANTELFKDHAQSHGTLFTVSYIPDVTFPEKLDGLATSLDIAEVTDNIDDLRQEIEELRNILLNVMRKFTY